MYQSLFFIAVTTPLLSLRRSPRRQAPRGQGPLLAMTGFCRFPQQDFRFFKPVWLSHKPFKRVWDLVETPISMMTQQRRVLAGFG